ncbi:MAG: hypothetical protein H6585_00345 [Flavobacteriales bacterium]|nr:hypothetical protein [Flavobacteriales bacterium]MCB9446774.1 hypothetical protein [Flavobacteriales bacterium]
MNLQAEIKWIKTELDKVKDPALIEVFKSLLNYRKKVTESDWWDRLSDEERSDIEAGIREANQNKLITHEEVMGNPRKWR